MGIVVPKLRASARGRPCSMRTGYCNHDPETTVLAHLPSPVKGMGNKGNDWHAVFACSACHDALDQHWLDEHEGSICVRALEETQRYWFEHGYLVIPGVLNTRAKPSSKIMPRKPMTVQS